MNPSGDDASVTIPLTLLAELQAEADKEHRSAHELLRDLLERGLRERRWDAHVKQERQRARDSGLPSDDQPMTDDGQSIHDKISQGLASARAGRLVDGDAFMALMQAELDRQGGK